MAIKSEIERSRERLPLRAEVSSRDRVFVQTGRPRLLEDTGLGQLGRSLPALAREAFGQARGFGERKGQEAEKLLRTSPNMADTELLRELGVPSFFSNLVLEAADVQRGQNTFQQRAPEWKIRSEEYASENPTASPDDLAAFAQDMVRRDLAEAGVTNNHASETLGLVGQVQRSWVNSGIVEQARARVSQVDEAVQAGFVNELGMPVNERNIVAYMDTQRHLWVTEKGWLSAVEWKGVEERMLEAAVLAVDSDNEDDAFRQFLSNRYADDPATRNKWTEKLEQRARTLAQREEYDAGHEKRLAALKIETANAEDGLAIIKLEKEAIPFLSLGESLPPELEQQFSLVRGGVQRLNQMLDSATVRESRLNGISDREFKIRQGKLLDGTLPDPWGSVHRGDLSYDQNLKFIETLPRADEFRTKHPEVLDMRADLVDRLQRAEVIGGSFEPAAGGSESSLAGVTRGGGRGTPNTGRQFRHQVRKLSVDYFDWINASGDAPRTPDEINRKQKELVDAAFENVEQISTPAQALVGLGRPYADEKAALRRAADAETAFVELMGRLDRENSFAADFPRTHRFGEEVVIPLVRSADGPSLSRVFELLSPAELLTGRLSPETEKAISELPVREGEDVDVSELLLNWWYGRPHEPDDRDESPLFTKPD